MKIAFYAPLKAPDAATPSGDRLIARMLIGAIRRSGHEILLASRFRSLDLAGDAQRQQRIGRVGSALARRLVRRLMRLSPADRPKLWLTYHLYHKAPDWLGPAVSEALAIPYALAEASYAPKQRHGPWAQSLEQTGRALATARLVIGLNPADAECVRPCMRPDARYLTLAPFIDGAGFRVAATRRDETRAALASAHGLDPALPWLIAVGMMRAGNKLNCYQMLAAALTHIERREWQLLIVGDGPARAQVATAFGAHLSRVRWFGALAGEQLAAVYAASDLFVWPAINEPIGMVFLEAQAAGLAIVGSDREGVRGIVRDGITGTLVAEGDAGALAAAVAAMLDAPRRRVAMGQAAARHALEHHELATHGRRVVAALEELVA